MVLTKEKKIAALEKKFEEHERKEDAMWEHWKVMPPGEERKALFQRFIRSVRVTFKMLDQLEELDGGDDEI